MEHWATLWNTAFPFFVFVENKCEWSDLVNCTGSPLFTFVFSKSEFTAFASVLHCNSSAVGTLPKAVNPDCSKFGQIGPTFVLHSQRHLPWSSSWWWCLRTQITERKIAARLWLNWTNFSTAEVLQMSWKCFIYVLPLIWWLQSLIVRHSSPRHSS